MGCFIDKIRPTVTSMEAIYRSLGAQSSWLPRLGTVCCQEEGSVSKLPPTIKCLSCIWLPKAFAPYVSLAVTICSYFLAKEENQISHHSEKEVCHICNEASFCLKRKIC